MKKALLLALLLLALPAMAQTNYRWDSVANTTTGVGQMVPMLALPGASVSFYTGCTTLPCATKATTYISASSASTCPSTAQIVWQLPLSQTCTATADSQGNFGGYFQPGTYQYTVTVSGQTAGPYQFNVGSGSGGANLPYPGLVYGTSVSGGRTGTAADITTLVQGQTNCNTAGYVWSPQAGACVANSGGTTGGPLNDAGYGNSGGSTVAPLSNSFTLPNSLSATALQTAVTATGAGNVTYIKGPQTTFTNNSNYNVIDQRIGATVRPVGDFGAACDVTINGYITESQGATTATVSNYTFATSDGSSTGANPKWISIVYPSSITGGAPERFDTYVVSVSGSTITVHTAFPYAATGWSFTAGHDDTSALFTAAEYAATTSSYITGFVLGLPNTGLCWSRTAPWYLGGQSVVGYGATGRDTFESNLYPGILGGAGMDAMATCDPNNLTPCTGLKGEPVTGQILRDFYIDNDARIDATQAWNFDNDGTVTSENALYRPAAAGSSLSNQPLAPGWVRGSEPYGLGGYGGVASTSASNDQICVLTGGTPAVGDDIIFPYLSGGLFRTTVASLSGTCGTGTPVTLTAAPSSSVAQAEYYYGENPSAATSGTAIQEITTSIPATGRTWPMTINLANPISPQPGVSWNVAPWGLVEIDDEQFYYYGTSNYPIQTGSFIILTSSVQNGTGSTGPAHSVDAPIVPLNPWEPTWPWPFSTINGAPLQTPANAEFFPGLNIGNCALAEPWASHQGNGSIQGFAGAKLDNITFATWPYQTNSGESATSFTEQNSTCGVYLAGNLPFNTNFRNIKISGPQYGWIESTPATFTHNWITNGYPTADQSNFTNFTINGAVGALWIGGGTNSWEHFQHFCQNVGPIGPFQAGVTASATTLGCQVDAMWIASFLDDTEGLSQGQNTVASGVKDGFIDNNYAENDSGTYGNWAPTWEFDGTNTTWAGKGDTSSGSAYIGGSNNIFLGSAFFNPGTNLPLTNVGTANSFLLSQALAPPVNGGGGIKSSTWGSSNFVDFGEGTAANSGSTIQDAGSTDQRLSLGATAPMPGQTNETFVSGNTTAPFPNSQAGYIPASMMHIFSSGALGWFYDGEAINPSQGYVGCAVGTNAATQYCNVGAPLGIGPGQQIAAGYYVWYLWLKQAASGSQTVKIVLQDSSGNIDASQTAIPISNTWALVALPVENLSSQAGKNFSFMLGIYGVSSTATTVEIAAMSLAPVAQNITSQQYTATGSGSGQVAVSGSTSGTVTQTVKAAAGTYTFTWPTTNTIPVFLGTVTTSGSTTETFSNAYITASSHCFAQGNNSTAATGVYFSSYGSGSVTVNNSNVTGQGFDIWCAAD